MSGKGSGLTKPMKLSADLAELVGKKEASRAECVKQLWAYLKKNNLQVRLRAGRKVLAPFFTQCRSTFKWDRCYDFSNIYAQNCCYGLKQQLFM
jgi:hypothetical protein